MAHDEKWLPRGLPEFKIFADNFCAEVADCTQTVLYRTKKGHVVFTDTHFGMAFVAFARYFNTRLVLGTVATKFGRIVS